MFVVKRIRFVRAAIAPISTHGSGHGVFSSKPGLPVSEYGYAAESARGEGGGGGRRLARGEGRVGDADAVVAGFVRSDGELDRIARLHERECEPEIHYR